MKMANQRNSSLAVRVRSITLHEWLFATLTASGGATALLCLLFASAVADGSKGYAQTLSGHETSFTAVTEALRERNFQQALMLSEASLKQFPSDYRLWTLRGFAYSGAGKEDLALSAFHRALALNPDYVAAIEGAAEIEYSRGDARAKPVLEHLLALRPASATAQAMLAVLEYRAGHCEMAVKHFEQAGALIDSQPVALAQYGSCLTKLHRYEEASRAFNTVVSLEPQDEHARYNFAVAEVNLDRPQQALDALRPVIGDTTDEGVLTLAASLEEQSGNGQGAVDLLRQAITANPDSVNAYLQFAALASNHESYQVGIDILNYGLTRQKKSAQLHLARGVLYAEMGKMTEGMQEFETANELDPALSFARIAEGIADSQQHNDQNALSTFRANARRHPDDALSQYLLAEALANEAKPQGSPEYQEELHALKRALSLDPTLSAASGLLQSLYLRSGDAKLAIHSCEEALRVDPTDQQALFHLILAVRKTDRRGEIPELTKRLLALRGASQDEGSKRRFRLVEDSSLSTHEAYRHP
jgi:tetratricopeptide (TPR) repeat protein